MLDKLTNSLDFHTKALVLRADRQRLIASNIANADTPGFAARDMNFAEAMRNATAGGSAGGNALAMRASSTSSADMGAGRAGHIALGAGSASGAEGGDKGYVVQTQPTLDGNSVDLDRERAAFADNAVRYEATLRFINGQSKTMLAAIQGQ